MPRDDHVDPSALPQLVTPPFADEPPLHTGLARGRADPPDQLGALQGALSIRLAMSSQWR